MKLKMTSRVVTILLTLSILFSNFTVIGVAAPASTVTFTILHTNDFHGQLDNSLSSSNPGMAKVATAVNTVRTSVGAPNVLLVDAGDEMQGSLLSNLGDGTATGKGKPTIDVFNTMGYNVATFGNHEFDWGQVNLANRTAEAAYPYVTANIVKNDTGNCATAGWQKPDFADNPFEVLTVGSPVSVKVAFIGVTTTETPTITVATATAGLCFKDPADSILHYYDAMKAAGADVIVVLSHLGLYDGGYGYGIPVYGDAGTSTSPATGLAAKLNAAGKPVNLIIGGHSHSNLSASTVVGNTTIVQAYYNGRTLGRADVTVSTNGTVTVAWSRLTPLTGYAADPTIAGVINKWATDPSYVTLVNTPVGYSAVDLGRSNTSDNMMGTFIDDAIYNYLNTDAEPANDVDLFFNNAGGIRTDWCAIPDPANPGRLKWGNTATDCKTGLHDPLLLNYGHMFTILPFGNATAVGKMTGAQILEVINYGPNVAGVIQPAGLKYNYFSYKDANPGPQPYAWGAFDICVINKTNGNCDPLDLKKTYSVGTNEFLAPAGGDGYSAFKYMTNITYWGDMLNAVNAYVSTHYTAANPYKGPNSNGTLDGRIIRDGTDAGGSIIPLTILHHNDMHGNLYKSTYVGYTQLATLIKQERLHNPSRTLLLNSGDDIQGDGFSFFYKSSYTGKAVDGTVLASNLWTNPVMAAMNSMGYDAMTLGNHEYNFGSDVFKGVLGQATFPVLQANVSDDGSYGLAAANGGTGVQSYVTKIVGTEGIKVAIMGIGNHRVPNYELPSNIPGLTFSDPIAKAQELSSYLRPNNDVVIALTHIGFTENPSSVEVDVNVDTNLAAATTGINAIVGGHSHTDPSKQTAYSGNYKYLPSIVADKDGNPVIIGQAYRYNNTLGVEVLGLRALAGGGYEVVSETGRYLSVTMSTVEDQATKAVVDPYLLPFNNYNNAVIGNTTAPIDALLAFTQETTGANLQADASVEALRKTTTVDFHLSGAMTNKATTGPYPVTLKVADMFTLMPYENSLVVLSMNGPQLKAVLERAYRNYYYYKYVSGYGGYSYYTTCMIDINAGGKITYNDLSPSLPNGNNVVSLEFKDLGDNPKTVDFTDASTYYNVSTVNYLAAGSCNFNNSGATLWPLNQILVDSQLYVRDVVIDYIKAHSTVSPAIEGRLSFINDTSAPSITIITPGNGAIFNPPHETSLTLDFNAVEVGPAGLKSVTADLDGVVVVSGQVIDLSALGLGSHTLTVHAEDKAGNASVAAATFTVGDIDAPTITITSPSDGATYFHPNFLTLGFGAVDIGLAGVKEVTAALDGVSVTNGQVIDLYTLSLGNHTLAVTATDKAGNTSDKSVTFGVTATIQSLKDGVTRLYNEGKISDASFYQGLMDKLVAAESSTKAKTTANILNAFINLVQAQSGKGITENAATLVKTDAQSVIANLK